MIRRSNITRWRLFKFLLRRCATVLWAGVRVEYLDHSLCSVSIKRNRRNRNPYDGVYFANILTAAEMASGLMVFDEMDYAWNVNGIQLVAKIGHASAHFSRPVKGAGMVTCHEGYDIEQLVCEAAIQGKAVIRTHSTVTNERGKICADVLIVWHITRVNK